MIVNVELERMHKKTAVVYFKEGIPKHLSGGSEESHKYLSKYRQFLSLNPEPTEHEAGGTVTFDLKEDGEEEEK
jgi:hypothetical protein